MARKAKSFKICVWTSEPGERRWKKVCKKITKKQIQKLVGLPKRLAKGVIKIETF
jgi:hypothetical protein